MTYVMQALICLFSLSTFLFAGMQAKAQTSEGPDDSPDSISEQLSEEDTNSEANEDQVRIEKYIKDDCLRTLEQEYNEHGVDWHSWAEKVAGAVWGPLIERGALACGQSYVNWQVTRDCRVHIYSVYSPIPGGAKVIVDSIKALDRNPILTFPADSKRMVVDRRAWVGGRARLKPIRGPVRVYP